MAQSVISKLLTKSNLVSAGAAVLIGVGTLGGWVMASSGPAPAPLVAMTPMPVPSPLVKPITGPRLPNASNVTVTTVTKVGDGDDLQVTDSRGTVSLRLAGVNTPELAYGNQYSQCYSLEAFAKTKAELTGKTVVVERTRPNRTGTTRGGWCATSRWTGSITARS